MLAIEPIVSSGAEKCAKQKVTDAVTAANYGLGKDYDHATRMHGHMSGWFEDFKQNMNNLPVIPDEMTPITSKEE
jgi:hypothetical protein